MLSRPCFTREKSGKTRLPDENEFYLFILDASVFPDDMSEFAALFGLICAVLALHPVTSYPLSLLLIARMKGWKASATESKTDETAPASLAICMSAYNEEKIIAAKMERLLEIARTYGPATIHVYVDAPSDNTAAILKNYTDRADIVFGHERMGKTYGMNLLVNRSDSEFILFTDANVESSVNVARELVKPLLSDPTIGCATARLVYSNRKETATASLGALYWGMEEAIKRLESRSMGLIGCDGAMFMMRRSLHVSPPPHLIDDLYLSLTILIAGSRIVSVEDVEVFERSATRPDEEGHRKKRIACQAWNVHRALWPKLRRLPLTSLYAYISHRPMKWLMPFFVLGSALGFTVAIGSAFGPMAALACIAAVVAAYVIGGAVQLPPFSIFHSAVRSLAGIGVGTIESFAMRKTYTTWNPAISVRDQTESHRAG